MSTDPVIKDTGLRGVIVADTSISLVDGIKGELSYRGFDIHDLVAYSTYEEVAYLLLYGNLPTPPQLGEFSKGLASKRELPSKVFEFLEKVPKTTAPMDVLQAAIPLLAGFDSDLTDDSKPANFKRAENLIAKVPSVVAAWERIRNGGAPVAPDSSLSRAANFLYMLKGKKPDAETARDFDVCLILHAEHSFNASTFTARVVTSTRTHMYAAASAAVGALSGELHGGANAHVMRNLQEIGDPERVETWVKSEFDKHERVMGMGHAVYKTTDPRAEMLKRIAENLARRTGETKWYLITRKIEELTQREFRERKGSEIHPNVDLYSASVYHMMGIAPDLFTPVFAIARVAGWAAHIIEEKFPESPVKPELYRPDALYRGNYCGALNCKYVPVEKRLSSNPQQST